MFDSLGAQITDAKISWLCFPWALGFMDQSVKKIIGNYHGLPVFLKRRNFNTRNGEILPQN